VFSQNKRFRALRRAYLPRSVYLHLGSKQSFEKAIAALATLVTTKAFRDADEAHGECDDIQVEPDQVFRVEVMSLSDDVNDDSK
jgi:hypothetical protein